MMNLDINRSMGIKGIQIAQDKYDVKKVNAK
jgi:hypothetical protein